MQQTIAEIDLQPSIINLTALPETGGTAAVMAVVKANAYGHGAVADQSAGAGKGCSYLGVARVEEASSCARPASKRRSWFSAAISRDRRSSSNYDLEATYLPAGAQTLQAVARTASQPPAASTSKSTPAWAGSA